MGINSSQIENKLQNFENMSPEFLYLTEFIKIWKELDLDNSEIEELESEGIEYIRTETGRKILLFLDFDGTLTDFEGQNPLSLFHCDTYDFYQRNTENIDNIKKLFDRFALNKINVVTSNHQDKILTLLDLINLKPSSCSFFREHCKNSKMNLLYQLKLNYQYKDFEFHLIDDDKLNINNNYESYKIYGHFLFNIPNKINLLLSLFDP